VVITVLALDTDVASHCITATLTGTLTSADVPRLRHTLDALLTPARPVILDVTRLRTNCPPAVEALSRSLVAAGGWPTARLVVAGPDPRFRAALRSTGTIRDVVVADDVQDAHLRLHDRPERVRRRLALGPGTAAPARAFVHRACADWGVPHLAADARRVTTALVRGTRTSAVLTITLGPEGLRIALRDFAASPVPVGVARLSSTWGVTPRSDGKAVWVVLPRAS
jgi:hypothetical protein